MQIDPKACVGMAIEDFVTANTRSLRLGLPSGFLDCDPDDWMLREDCQQCLTTVRNLRVVNDNADGALIEENNNVLTKKENQKQYLNFRLRDHRRQFLECTKSSTPFSE
jgi:hypothetical protein